jgi:hypothetical protein
MSRQYVFCLPCGGFNDLTAQLARAWNYAETHKRVLVTDARRFFHDALSRYFTTDIKDIVLHPGENLLRHFDTLQTYPPDLRGQCRRPPDSPMHPLPSAMGSLSIDLSRAYREDLLVHYAYGGGRQGHEWLRKMRLVPGVALTIARSLAVLGEDYDAVHIRNTDIETKYLPFFRGIFPLVRGRKLLVCSDDLSCREAAKKFFVESQVVTVTEIPDTGGKNLHSYAGQDVYSKNLTMLTDLLALARSRRLFVSSRTSRPCGRHSGFSHLAQSLHTRPEIVDGFFASLSPPEIPFGGNVCSTRSPYAPRPHPAKSF